MAQGGTEDRGADEHAREELADDGGHPEACGQLPQADGEEQQEHQLEEEHQQGVVGEDGDGGGGRHPTTVGRAPPARLLRTGRP
ncbi:hypothetical protein GCM10010302_78570 [Streptomyces polychromogenes]|uniref:Uncharacterized protein n=1 Tax=Streptomyces polychromogenes TaxID=67342 RepID=A0ABP3FW61_9ACTN